MSKKRGSFSGGLGFVFAAAGSAVGLGNLWRFPYYAAKYGAADNAVVRNNDYRNKRCKVA